MKMKVILEDTDVCRIISAVVNEDNTLAAEILSNSEFVKDDQPGYKGHWRSYCDAHYMSEEDIRETSRLARAGLKIQAIKKVRNATSIGLLEGKRLVEDVFIVEKPDDFKNLASIQGTSLPKVVDYFNDKSFTISLEADDRGILLNRLDNEEMSRMVSADSEFYFEKATSVNKDYFHDIGVYTIDIWINGEIVAQSKLWIVKSQ